MQTIEYKGKKYPIRTFIVDEVPYEITIAPESLEDALGDDWEDGSVEEIVDADIYFYVEDVVFDAPAEEICADHLDMPMRFVEEIGL